MRMADRPHGDVLLAPNEKKGDYRNLKYPGVHSFRAGRSAGLQAYKMAGITDPLKQIDFVELHDAYTSSEIQTYEDLALCKYGDGGKFVEAGYPFMPQIDYGMKLPMKGTLPVNPSGGLIACGTRWARRGSCRPFSPLADPGEHQEALRQRGAATEEANRGLIHSHAGTGTYVTVSIMERGW